MKIRKIIFLLIVALTINYACEKHIQKLNIGEIWKFRTGDSIEFSNADFNDTGWKNIKAGEGWESQGFKDYDGIAWYRMKLNIPSSLKPVSPKSVVDGLELFPGKIDDNDICYFNGEEIGRTAGYNINRQYFIPLNKIVWDKENVIAIRVEDTGGRGGLYEGPYLLKIPVISDILSITCPDGLNNIEDTLLNPEVHFKWKIPVNKICGKMDVSMVNSTTKTKITSVSEKICIGKMADSIFTCRFPILEPGVYKAFFCFTTSEGKDSCCASALIGYKKINHSSGTIGSAMIENKIPDKCSAFPYGNILLSGYLQDRLLTNLNNRILKIDEKGILECFYNRPGKQEWVGEYAGKYLNAASRIWQYTRNNELKTQMDRIADILISCQNEDGYLGTYLPQDYWTSWDVWAHKYDLLGLLSYYAATGYKPALDVSRKIGDLLCNTFGKGKNQRELVKAGYHAGMAPCSVLEPMTYLYRYTGEKKYLDFCNYIIEDYDSPAGPKIIATLTSLGKVDKTANGKAYEMMSNLVGIVKLYQLNGDSKLLKAAENAWTDISMHKLYITGTASAGEFFRDDFDLPAENNSKMGEGCVSVTWLQFSQALYYLTADSKYMDEIEKTIYNHLLAAENPQTGCVSYYTALMGKKPYRCSIDGNCCLASVPRGFSIIPELVYSRLSNNGLAINIYSSGKIDGKIKTASGKETFLHLNIESNFPASGKVIIRLMAEKPGRFTLALRVPAWSRNFIAKVPGKELKGEPGKYLEINEEWGNSNKIEISFDLNPHFLEGGKSYPEYKAIQIGAQVLAYDESLNPGITEPEKISISGTDLNSISKCSVQMKNWVGSQKFQMEARYENKPVRIYLVPFADAGQTEGDVRVWLRN